MTVPLTSISDGIWLLVVSVAVGLMRYYAACRRYRVSTAEVRMGRRSYAVLFLISWFPFLLCGIGFIGVSILRDRGWSIFPWPIVANCLLLSLWLYLARRLESRYLGKCA